MSGAELSSWQPPAPLEPVRLAGRFVRVESLEETHAEALFAAFEGADRVWDFLPYGPFDRKAYHAWLAGAAAQRDPLFHAIVDQEKGALGVAAWLRVEPRHGVAEIGHLAFAPALQRTPAATEAMTLMADHVFAAGYRRYEWKCDAANAASRRAAQRLGFGYEGTFRQHMVVKGRNRDTAWFSILDRDWPAIRRAHEHWLQPDNFGPDGAQRGRLSTLTRPHLHRADHGRVG